MENNNVIYGINGPVVTVKNTDSFEMMEMVHVGKQKLVGEIIGITDDITTIQVYEETTGLKPGDPVEGTGAPMNVLLGPGIIDNIFDGIERPLKAIEEEAGAFINRGSSVSALDDKKLWNVTMRLKSVTSLRAVRFTLLSPKLLSLNTDLWFRLSFRVK